MQCPICKQETKREDNPDRPFCSERCRLIDLGNWLSGRYHISSPLPGEEVEDPEGREAAEAALD